MPDNPRLSIITVNLNNASGLRKTLQSVAEQTSRDVEHVVVDGGSTDGSVEVILEYADRLAWWVSEPDSGIYEAMNKGIRAARGEYCQFLNSGDWLVGPEVTASMLDDMPACSILYGNLIKVKKDGTVSYDTAIKDLSFMTFYTGTLNHACSYIRRSLFDRYGNYDEGLKIVSDWKFFLVAIGLNNESVVYKNIDVACFDMSGISNTNRHLERTERRQVLHSMVPAMILADYDAHWFHIEQMKRLQSYGVAFFAVSVFERILFKFEKWTTSIKSYIRTNKSQ